MITYTAELDLLAQKRLHHEFMTSSTKVAVETTAFKSELDIDSVDLIFHYNSMFGVQELQQQAG